MTMPKDGSHEPDLFEELEQDSKIDNTNLDLELTRIPYIQSKWMKKFLRLSRQLRKAETAYAQVKLARSKYWMGLGDDDEYREAPINRKVLKTELPDYLAADPLVLAAQEEYEVLRDVAAMVEKFISSLNNRGYNLGKAVDYVRWKNGG